MYMFVVHMWGFDNVSSYKYHQNKKSPQHSLPLAHRPQSPQHSSPGTQTTEPTTLSSPGTQTTEPTTLSSPGTQTTEERTEAHGTMPATMAARQQENNHTHHPYPQRRWAAKEHTHRDSRDTAGNIYRAVLEYSTRRTDTHLPQYMHTLGVVIGTSLVMAITHITAKITLVVVAASTIGWIFRVACFDRTTARARTTWQDSASRGKIIEHRVYITLSILSQLCRTQRRSGWSR